MKFFAVIPARGGSKGIKNKNLKSIGGKSLLERAINSVIEHMDVVVSTDSENIKSNALKISAFDENPIDLKRTLAGNFLLLSIIA